MLTVNEQFFEADCIVVGRDYFCLICRCRGRQLSGEGGSVAKVSATSSYLLY